jgi:hypothetical protein
LLGPPRIALDECPKSRVKSREITPKGAVNDSIHAHLCHIRTLRECVKPIR